jgi:hypothetical protein
MSDPFDVVRTANPVPGPLPFDGEVRQRIVAAIVTTERPTARTGMFASAWRRVQRARLLVAVAGVLVIAGASAAAVGIWGTPSGPPAGKFVTPPADEGGAASSYTVSVTPNLQGGGVGWCVATNTYFAIGGASGGYGCGYAPLPGRPIVATGGGSGGGRDGDVYSATTELVFLTTSEVAAVRVSPKLTIRTRLDPQLPDHYRVAIDITQTIAHHPINAPQPGQGSPAVALNADGRPFGMAASNTGEPRDAATFWPSPRAHTPPAGACEIETNGLHGASGYVVRHIHGFPDLTDKVFLSCADTQIASGPVRGTLAAILLDAQHPGSKPAPLPDATPVAGHPTTYNEPGIPAPTPVRRRGNARMPLRGPLSITARRIGNAWLLVQSDGTLAQRLHLLDQLGLCVRLTGATCPPPN